MKWPSRRRKVHDVSLLLEFQGPRLGTRKWPPRAGPGPQKWIIDVEKGKWASVWEKRRAGSKGGRCKKEGGQCEMAVAQAQSP